MLAQPLPVAHFGSWPTTAIINPAPTTPCDEPRDSRLNMKKLTKQDCGDLLPEQNLTVKRHSAFISS